MYAMDNFPSSFSLDNFSHSIFLFSPPFLWGECQVYGWEHAVTASEYLAWLLRYRQRCERFFTSGLSYACVLI